MNCPRRSPTCCRPRSSRGSQEHVKGLPAPTDHPQLTGENWRGALGVFLLVFLSTFPVVLPFIFMHDAHLALRLSNGIAIAMLFGCGHMLAGYAGLRRVRTGLAMVVIGAVLVGFDDRPRRIATARPSAIRPKSDSQTCHHFPPSTPCPLHPAPSPMTTTIAS